mgnify:CR=1 FL=1
MSLDPSQPPEFGEIEFHLHVPPVSQQAKAIDKQQIVKFAVSLQLGLDGLGMTIE